MAKGRKTRRAPKKGHKQDTAQDRCDYQRWNKDHNDLNITKYQLKHTENELLAKEGELWNTEDRNEEVREADPQLLAETAEGLLNVFKKYEVQLRNQLADVTQLKHSKTVAIEQLAQAKDKEIDGILRPDHEGNNVAQLKNLSI